MWLPPAFPRRRIVLLKYNLYFLSAAGLFALPFNEGQIYRRFYNVYFVLVMTCTSLVTILTAIDFCISFDDVDKLVDRGVILSALMAMLIKENTIVYHRDRIEDWVMMAQLRYAASKREERKYLLGIEGEMSRFTQLFFCIWMIISFSYTMPLYIGGPDPFELPTINAELLRVDSGWKYIFAYSWNTFALALAILGVFGSDLFMAAIYSQVVARLRALSDAIENIGKDSLKTRWQCHLLTRRLVRSCVREHSDIIKFVADLNNVFCYTLLVQSFLVTLIVASCGFYAFLSITHGEIYSSFKSILYIVAVMIENYLYCSFGDRVKYASLGVGDALLRSNWYTLVPQDRREILLILRASQDPLYMSVGNILRMDLEALRVILTSSYSYFTILQNIYTQSVQPEFFPRKINERLQYS